MPVSWEYNNNVLKISANIGESFRVNTISGVDASTLNTSLAFRHSVYASGEFMAVPSDSGSYIMAVHSHSLGVHIAIIVEVTIGGPALGNIGPIIVVLFPSQVHPSIAGDSLSYVFLFVLFLSIGTAFFIYSYVNWKSIVFMSGRE